MGWGVPRSQGGCLGGEAGGCDPEFFQGLHLKSLWLKCHPLKTQVPTGVPCGLGGKGQGPWEMLAVVLYSMREAWDLGLTIYMTHDTGLIHTHRHIRLSSAKDGYGASALSENTTTLAL